MRLTPCVLQSWVFLAAAAATKGEPGPREGGGGGLSANPQIIIIGHAGNNEVPCGKKSPTLQEACCADGVSEAPHPQGLQAGG